MRISEEIWPRPVAILTTVSKEGRPNGMTVSFLMPISFEPKYVAVSVSPRRYSFQNLNEVKEFGLNVLEKSQKKLAEVFGTLSGRDEDKFEVAGVKPIKSEAIRPPLIECPISLECEVVFMEEFGDHYVVIGKVLREHVRKKEFEPLLHKSGDFFPEIKV